MVWGYKLQTIVMLTKPVEASTVKCEVYWPEKVNKTLTLKLTLQVRTTYIQYFADFDMRAFELSNVSKRLCTNTLSLSCTTLMVKLYVLYKRTNVWYSTHRFTY